MDCNIAFKTANIKLSLSRVHKQQSLCIGQRDYMGKQLVYCKPFGKENDAGRMDCVFFIPPPPYYTGSRRDFDLSLENAWYGRVSLLCSMKFRTDGGEVRDVDCAMMTSSSIMPRAAAFSKTIVF